MHSELGFESREDVEGAPLWIGAHVRVVGVVDDTADGRFSGQPGVVTGYVYDCPDAQYPHEPLLLVNVEGLGEEVFFARELRHHVVQEEADRCR